jgi:hypothetical protein
MAVVSTINRTKVFYSHAGENRRPEIFDHPGLRVALAIASLPGMTNKFCSELLKTAAAAI